MRTLNLKVGEVLIHLGNLLLHRIVVLHDLLILKLTYVFGGVAIFKVHLVI